MQDDSQNSSPENVLPEVVPGFRDITSTNDGNPPSAAQPLFLPLTTVQFAIRESIVILLWIALVVKIFIFDFDIWLIQAYLPGYLWVFNFKALFFIALIAAVALVWKKSFLFRGVGYFVFYPLIFSLWKIPRFVLSQNSWALNLAFISLVINGIRNLRVNILVASGFIISTPVCLLASQVWLVYPAQTIAVTSLAILYWRAANSAMFPVLGLFSDQLLNKLWKYLENFTKLETEFRSFEVMSAEEVSKSKSALQFLVLYNAACTFFINRLTEVRQSNLMVSVYTLRLLALFVANLWTFFLLNFSLFSINASNFTTDSDVSKFNFFFYSFNKLFANSAGGIEPASTIAKIYSMAGTVSSGIFLLVIIVFIVTTVQKNRDESQLEVSISAITSHADQIEPYIDRQFGMDIQEAVKALRRLKAEALTLIYLLAPHLNLADENPPENGAG